MHTTPPHILPPNTHQPSYYMVSILAHHSAFLHKNPQLGGPMSINSIHPMPNNSPRKSQWSGSQQKILCDSLNSVLRTPITKTTSMHLTNLEIRSLSTYILCNCWNQKDLVPSSLRDMMDHSRSLSVSAQWLIEYAYLILMGFTQCSASHISNHLNQTLFKNERIYSHFERIQKNTK